MKRRLIDLQGSLAEARKDSTLNITPTSLDPLLENSPDPRIKILSTITLASIAVALLSVIIAYFF